MLSPVILPTIDTPSRTQEIADATALLHEELASYKNAAKTNSYARVAKYGLLGTGVAAAGLGAKYAYDAGAHLPAYVFYQNAVLLGAIKSGNLRAVKAAVAKGADLFAISAEALHFCTKYNRPEIAVYIQAEMVRQAAGSVRSPVLP